MDNWYVVVSLLVFAGILTVQFKSLPPFHKRKDAKKSKLEWAHGHPPPLLADDDKISQLPYDILCSIISRLVVKEAVRTSILSRTWRYVYLFMPTLNFGPSHLYTTPRSFVKTINHILQQRMCSCLIGNYVLQFEQWMSSIARIGYEHLDITFGNMGGMKELISEMAGSWKHMNLLQRNLVLCRFVRFNSLKRLRIWGCRLCGEELSIIFSSCLNLESIEFVDCELPPKLSINASHKLKNLDIEYCKGTRSIQICAASLVSFMFVCLRKEKLLELSLSGVPKLKRLHVFDPFGTFPMPRVFCDFATELPLLEWFSFRVITDKLKYINAARNAFGNLKQLYINFMVDLLPNLLNVTPILEACPVLEKFYLGVNRNNLFRQDQNVRMQLAHIHRDDSQEARLHLWKVKDRVETSSLSIPIRHHLHLKEVTLGGFWGTETDIEFALFILKRAVVLEQMVIRGTLMNYTGKSSAKMWMEERDAHIEENVREMMYRKLHGQAISTTAKVIIDGRGILITEEYLRVKPSTYASVCSVM